MLRREEMEIIITIADDEKSLHVFTESKRSLSTRLLKVAAACGVEPTPLGEGFQFDLPLRCLSVRVPRRATAETRTRLAASLAKARLQKRVLTPETLIGIKPAGTPSPATPDSSNPGV